MYLLIVFGNASFTGFNGGMTTWANDFVEEYFGIAPLTAVLISGVVTLFNGVISTSGGAVINDKRIQKKKDEISAANDTLLTERINSAILIERGMQLTTILAALSYPILIVGWVSNMYIPFMTCYAIAQALLYMTISPMNAALFESVPLHLRNQASAVSIFTIHLFGDFPSPLIVGVLFQTIGMYLAIFILLQYVLAAFLFYYYSYILSQNQNTPSLCTDAIFFCRRRQDKIFVKQDDRPKV